MRTFTLLVAAVVTLAVTAVAWASPAQKVVLTMRDISYSPTKLTLAAGTPAEITITNKGKITHAFALYAMPKDPASMTGGETGHEWVEKTNYFKGINATTVGGKVERRGGSLFEISVLPGKSVTLKFTPVKKGTFEYSCLLPGHYEAGQRGVLVIK